MILNKQCFQLLKQCNTSEVITTDFSLYYELLFKLTNI